LIFTVKILHVTPSVGSARGGATQAVIELLQALHVQECDAELATTNDNAAELLDVPLNKLVSFQHIPARFFSRFSPQSPPVRDFAFSSDLTHWLWKHIADYDLVHIHALFSYPSTIAMKIARTKGVPYVVQPHGLLCEWSLQQSKLKKQLYLDLVERSNLQHSCRMIVTSEMEDREVEALNLRVPRSLVPIGLAIPTANLDARQKLRDRLKVPLDQPIILFLSRLHPKKGLDYLIPALEKLRDQPFTFVVAGNGTPKYEAEIDQWIEAAGLSDRTHRPGFVSGEFKQLLLQGSDIFILTSHSENFGVVVLEAMASGLTTILTPGVALSSMLEEHQVGYVTPLEVNEIAHTLKYCLDSPQRSREIGKRARQFITQHYAWNHIANQMIETYQVTLKGYRQKIAC
jgi:glycosyltransferase involved in cell wall biosynthesis